jgi:hypothetical protein
MGGDNYPRQVYSGLFENRFLAVAGTYRMVDNQNTKMSWAKTLIWLIGCCLVGETLGLGLGKILPVFAAWAGEEPIDIGDRRELFVDSLLIERIEGVYLQLHHPQPQEIVFRFDQPWEGKYSGYITVLRDGEKFLMYYRGMPRASHDLTTEATCLAESSDGIHWIRPQLGLFEVAGTKDNNVVLAGHPACHNFAPFADTRPNCPPDARFKALGGPWQELFAFASPDGVHWRPLQEKPVFTKGAFDSQNNAFWSETEQQYVLYFRVFREGFRWIARTTSKDFLHWEEPVDLEPGYWPREHLYTNQLVPYPRAPHIYLGFPTRFFPGRRVLTEEEIAEVDVPKEWNFANDCTDILLVSTRGGAQFHRFMEAFLRPGRDLRNWTSRANYAARGIFEKDGEVFFYVQHHYGYPSNHLRRYTIRADGFVSVRANYQGGYLLTKPIRFSGAQLRINFSTSAGGCVKVELQTAQGKPIPGFALSDCPELIGDRLDHPVQWTSGKKVAELAGQPVRLLFYLRDADLFSFRFHSEN